MLKWLQRPSRSHPPAPDASLPEGWFAPQSAERLLATPLRQSCLQQLRQLTPLPDTLFDSWILTAIHHFAELVQLLPASQSHHHSIAGGYWIIRWKLPATPSGFARVTCCHQKRGRKNRPGRPAHGRSR